MRRTLRRLQNRLSRAISIRLQRIWYAAPPLPLPWFSRWLLSLSAALYATALRRDQRWAMRDPRRLPAFVISVGNLVVGGAGKTPLCLWLTRLLQRLSWQPAILSRGYKSHHAGVIKAMAMGVSSSQSMISGDEPLLLAYRAKSVPVWVGKDRWSAGKLAIERDHANVLILDDGFQHLRLKRNLDLALLDAHNPVGNGALLPLGPLREPFEHLERADAVVLTRAEDAEQTARTRALIASRFPGKPVFSCCHRLTGLRVGLDGRELPLEALRGRKTVAFAGIARPETFFHLLKQAGIVVTRKLPFSDHHQYDEVDCLMLLKAMEVCETKYLVTTEKDMVRLPCELQCFTLAALLELDFGSQHEAFCEFLRKSLERGCCHGQGNRKRQGG